MTGESIPTEENWPRLKPYYMKLVATLLIGSGSFLILEHLWTFGQFDLLDILGHETYGIIMIVGGMILMTDFKQWKELKLWKLRNIIR